MSEVKWIKITTDMFEDEKIDFIQSLPEADSILVVWVRLLTLAGKCNAGGYIYLTENIPYTDDMLAHKFRKPINTIRLAIETFIKLGMMEGTDKGLYLPNWDKHQNIEGLDKIREQTRKRVNAYREKQKALIECNVTSNATVTEGNATDKELEVDKEIDSIYTHEGQNKDKSLVEKAKNNKPSKNAYAEFVYMTEGEYKKLVEKYQEPNAKLMIEKLDNYKGANGKKYKSDYKAILSWVADEIMSKVKPKEPVQKPASFKLVNQGCCPACNGKGVIRQNNEWIECPECKGGKKVG